MKIANWLVALTAAFLLGLAMYAGATSMYLLAAAYAVATLGFWIMRHKLTTRQRDSRPDHADPK